MIRKRHGRTAVWMCWLSLATGLLSPVVGAGEAGEEPELVAFVGRLTEVRELNHDCGRDCWNFDSGYALTYSVLEVLSGDTGRNEESFDFFGHYGLPAFVHYDTALLFVFKGERSNVMARYLAFPVAQTDEGNWAFCGDPYPEDTPGPDRAAVHRVRFRSPVVLSDVTARYRDDASWRSWFNEMKPGRERCRRAVFVEDLVEHFQPRAEPGHSRVYLFPEPQGQDPQSE